MADKGSEQDPARFDPWSGRRMGGVSWIATSTVIHVVLLVVLGTVSVTVIRNVEKIVVDVVGIDDASPQEFDGANSLEDLAGLLNVAPAPRRQAARPRAPQVKKARAPEIPKLGGVGPKLGRGPKIDASLTSLSMGAGIGGLGGNFGDYVGGLRKSGLDLALVIDTTESMQFVIDDVKAQLSALVATIQRMVPTSRVAIVVYRDRGEEYVVKWTDLSFKTEKLQAFLAGIRASGGGDWEEAVLDGVDAAVQELSWRKKSKRIIVLVGGSPPHQEDLQPLQALVRDFRDAGGSLSAVDVTLRLHLEFNQALWRSLYGEKPFEPTDLPDFYKQVSVTYQALAESGGGELVQLGQNKKLVRDILELTFGTRWKVEMAKHMRELS